MAIILFYYCRIASDQPVMVGIVRRRRREFMKYIKN